MVRVNLERRGGSEEGLFACFALGLGPLLDEKDDLIRALHTILFASDTL